MRLFAIDGRLYPEHCIIAKHWKIHSADRLKAMATTSWMQIEEQRFLTDPVQVIGHENLARLAELPALLQLDFFGIDFTMLEDGRLLLFEVNPCMRINQDFIERFPYQRPALDQILTDFRSLLMRATSTAARKYR